MGKPRNTRKYPIVFLDTPTRPEPDPLPCILSNTRPDPILKNPTRWALAIPHIGQFWYNTTLFRPVKSTPKNA